MTSRHLAEVAIKILGVYFGASAFVAAIQFLASFAMPPMEGFPPASAFALASGLPIVGWLTISAVSVWRRGNSSWEPVLKSTLTVIVGGTLAKSAGTLAAKLDRGES